MIEIYNQVVLLLVLILLGLGYYATEYGTDGLEKLIYRIIDKISGIGRRIERI